MLGGLPAYRLQQIGAGGALQFVAALTHVPNDRPTVRGDKIGAVVGFAEPTIAPELDEMVEVDREQRVAPTPRVRSAIARSA